MTKNHTTSRMRRRETIEGWVFIAPLLVGLVFFTAGPVLASLVNAANGLRGFPPTLRVP